MADAIFQYEFLKVEDCGKYCVLTLNRPDARNALSAALRAEFLDFVTRCEDFFTVVIITGAGKGFCAGLDLKEKPGTAANYELWEIARKIYTSRSIFITAVNGAARGGGLTLVNMCDLSIAAPEATFGIPEIGFGAYATMAAPTTQFVAPKKLTAHMVLTGKAIDADEALRGYLINEIAPPGELITAAKAAAVHLLTLSPGALAIAKQGLNRYPFDVESRTAAVELSLQLNAENGIDLSN